jgi:hypothetical protein
MEEIMKKYNVYALVLVLVALGTGAVYSQKYMIDKKYTDKEVRKLTEAFASCLHEELGTDKTNKKCSDNEIIVMIKSFVRCLLKKTQLYDKIVK